ncbi:NAD(P)-binding protein [Venturia nashicola]|uniref:NAD(P)-binding protein n=1 Tax=Venturia nashicola TaxID=86259 RepID=A0A4Z1PIT9_9PEZI|nr:NAD(P)-binding protein [Venturia nashicola]
MAPKALVTGASGLLGREVAKSFEYAHWDVVGTGLTRAKPPSIVKLDLLNGEDIKRVLDEEKPDVIVHCAANRFPDSCTKDPDAARAINVASTGTLASEAYKRSIVVIYISTDYVFSGKPGEAPYTTSSPTGPPNVYGETKLEGEQTVLEATKDTNKGVLGVVLRVPVLYGRPEANDPAPSAVYAIVDAVRKAEKLKEGEARVKVDDYGIRFPTATEDVGRVCVDIAKLYSEQAKADPAKKDLPRILQFSSSDKYTKYDMAKVFADILGLPTDKIEAWDPTKDDEEGKSTTVRPYNTQLDTNALKDLGISTASLNFVAWW